MSPGPGRGKGWGKVISEGWFFLLALFLLPKSYAALSCVAISGLGADQTGAYQKIYPYFKGPQIGGTADFDPAVYHYPATVTAVLYLGAYPCPVFASWKDAHQYLVEKATAKAPPALPDQVVILHLAHGFCGGGITCDSAEALVGPVEIIHHLYDLAAYYQVALINDACYGSDLQIAKLAYEINYLAGDQLYPSFQRELYKIGRVCLLTSSPVGLYTRGTPLVHQLCQASAQRLADPAQTVFLNLSPLEQDSAKSTRPHNGQNLVEFFDDQSFLQGQNLLGLLREKTSLFWSGLDFDQLGVSDSLYFAQREALAERDAGAEGVLRERLPAENPDLLRAAAQANQKLYLTITERLGQIIREPSWQDLQRAYALGITNSVGPNRLRFAYEDALAPFWYWIMAYHFGQNIGAWQELMRFAAGGWLAKDEALTWMDDYPLEIGLAELARGIAWWRQSFPVSEFPDVAAMQKAFQEGRGNTQWFGFPQDLATAAHGLEDPAHAANFDLIKLQRCLQKAHQHLRAKLMSLPAEAVITEEYIARALEESFALAPGRAAADDEVNNCYAIRAAWGLSFFRTQWEVYFPEMMAELRALMAQHRPANFREMEEFFANLANPGVVAQELDLIAQQTKELQFDDDGPHDLKLLTMAFFWQRMRDHVLAWSDGLWIGREDADPISQRNFEPLGTILPLLARQSLKNYVPQWPRYDVSPGSEIDRLRSQACLNFGAPYPEPLLMTEVTVTPAPPKTPAPSTTPANSLANWPVWKIVLQLSFPQLLR